MQNKQIIGFFLTFITSSFLIGETASSFPKTDGSLDAEPKQIARYPASWRNMLGNGSHYICTRSGEGVVNLRKAPGIDEPKGLEQVGSGGRTVSRMFQQYNYTLPVGFDLFQTFSKTRGSDNKNWTLIGMNQWTGWVRSDFVCHR